MERDHNSVLTYYGWCSNLPYRTIFFPTPPILEREPVSDFPVKEYVLKALVNQKRCVTIRRFLTHILPAGFTKVRSCGFLAGCVRAKNIALICSLLKKEFHPKSCKDYVFS